ncbi:MAG: 4Fe-4S dicluster domain-containing protein, partial [Flavobacteriales bacterium]
VKNDNKKNSETNLGGDIKHITYDPISASGILKANEKSFGKKVIPDYNFSKANVIVSVTADFMSNWLLPTKFTKEYSERRDPDGHMSRHFQFESVLTITGSNADIRGPIKPSQEGLVLASIYNHLATKAGKSQLSIDTSAVDKSTKKPANELWKNKGESIVAAGSNDENIQLIANSINKLLGNYDNTIDLNNPLYIKQGDEQEVSSLIEEMKNGEVDALFIYGVNPAYCWPEQKEFKEAMKNVGTTISFASHMDETASLCQYVCPDNHFLESWNDFNPKKGHYAIAQPAIRNLFNTRQAPESFLRWAGIKKDYHDFIKENWEKNYFPRQSKYNSFEKFWGNSVHNGSVNLKSSEKKQKSKKEEVNVELDKVEEEKNSQQTASLASLLTTAAKAVKEKVSRAGKKELFIYQKTGLGNGNHANNPWLQELPDPISRVTWDNYITMSPEDAKKEGYNVEISQESPATMAKVKANGREMKLPVFGLPGQTKGTIGIALGYGRGENGESVGKAAFKVTQYGKFKKNEKGNPIPVGKNAYPLINTNNNGQKEYRAFNVEMKNTRETYPLAATQLHHTIMGRYSILKDTTMDVYKNGKKEDYNHSHKFHVHEDGEKKEKNPNEVTLWEDHSISEAGHHWGLSIDLNLCIGCGACVTACQSENNTPVVGKDEIRRSRDMYWLRIDRYFSTDVDEELHEGKDFSHEVKDTPSTYPEVTFMPMMCQHCNHAPCETVCPVAATSHSQEGLNQMAYNRCVGTRYCANNCPYKVRRFNWFNYNGYKKFSERNPSQDDLGRMVLNPDVTVRSRGVMEKCSMCVQRIQAGKLEAKKEKRKLKDGEIQTACADACPTNAITFGDLNDKNSKVKEDHEHKRAYFALEEIGTRPNVGYKLKVRNKEGGHKAHSNEKEQKNGHDQEA